MSLRRKLVLAFIFTGTATFLLALVALLPLRGSVTAVGDFHAPVLASLQNLEANAKNAVQESFAYVVSGVVEERDEFLEWSEDFDRQLAQFRRLARMDSGEEAREAALLDEIETWSVSFIDAAKTMFREYEATGAVSRATFLEYEHAIDAFVNATRALVLIEETEVMDAHDLALSALSKAQMLMLLVGLIGLAVAATIGIVAARQIAAPLVDLTQAAEELGKGDLSRRVEVTSGDELGLLGRTLNQMAGELQESQDSLLRKEKLATLGQITSTVSHELRNPLGALRTSMAAMKRIAPDAEGDLARLVGIADRSILRCDKIIEELLDFARVSPLALETTRFDDWCAAELNEYRLDSAITLRRNLDSGAEVELDRNKFHRAILNVLDNACQAMLESRPDSAAGDHVLTFETRVTDGRLEVVVSDTGSGIPEESSEKIFEPLFSTRSFGIGLGMPTVKQILEQHEGGVSISGQEERGARVVLWLPLSQNPVEDLRT